MRDAAARAAALGLDILLPPAPRGDYVRVQVHDGLAHVSGQLSREGDEVVTGPATADTDPAVYRRAARACVSRVLGALNHELGGLDAVQGIVSVRGFVFSDPTFARHSAVLDQVSGLFAEVFGEAGRHARTAVGVASLPDRGLLEIEVVAAITPTPTTHDEPTDRSS